MTTDNLEKYFRSNAAVEVVAQAIGVMNFVGDYMLYFSRYWSLEVIQDYCK